MDADDGGKASAGSAAEFPGLGRRYRVTFPAFRFEVHFESPSSLTWTQIHEDGSRGRFETVAIHIEPIAGLIFLVAWQEANKTTVVHVEDFARRVIFTNITRSDGTFLQARGTLVELPQEARRVQIARRQSPVSGIL